MRALLAWLLARRHWLRRRGDGPAAVDAAVDEQSTATWSRRNDGETPPAPPGRPHASIPPARTSSTAFPSDARRRATAAGVRRLAGAVDKPIGRRWLDTANELVSGWGLVSGEFIWFDGEVDGATLPATSRPASTARPDGQRFPRDVDPLSPRSRRPPAHRCRARSSPGPYHPGNQLACISHSASCAAQSRIALVVTTDVRGVNGGAARATMRWRPAGRDDVDGAEGTTTAPPTPKPRLLGARGCPVRTWRRWCSSPPAIPPPAAPDCPWYEELPAPAMDAEAGFELVNVYDDYIVLRASPSSPSSSKGLPFASPRPADRPGEDGRPVIRTPSRCGST